MEQARIVITLDDTGRLNVDGSIDNKLIAYGLLELAKEAIVAHHAAQERKVQPVSAAERLALAGVVHKV